MNITYDEQADAAYFSIVSSRKVAWTEEKSDSILVDYDKNGKVLGIEVLFASKQLTNLFDKKFLGNSKSRRSSKTRQLA